MEVKVFTTDSADEAEAMRVDMVNTGFTVIVSDNADVVTIKCDNLTNGSTSSGVSSWVVIGKK